MIIYICIYVWTGIYSSVSVCRLCSCVRLCVHVCCYVCVCVCMSCVCVYVCMCVHRPWQLAMADFPGCVSFVLLSYVSGSERDIGGTYI